GPATPTPVTRVDVGSVPPEPEVDLLGAMEPAVKKSPEPPIHVPHAHVAAEAAPAKPASGVKAAEAVGPRSDVHAHEDHAHAHEDIVQAPASEVVGAEEPIASAPASEVKATEEHVAAPASEVAAAKPASGVAAAEEAASAVEAEEVAEAEPVSA